MRIYFKGNLRILLLSVSGIVMMTLSYLTYYFDPKETIGRKAALITPWSITMKFFKNPPYNIMMRVYLFNVTNSQEFISGKDENIKFKEVGPYTFREVLQNTNMEFHDNGTLSFIPKRSLEFLPELSINDPKQDTIIIPNVPLLGIASMLHQSSLMMNLAVSSLITLMDPKPFLNITVDDYFWGYEDSLVEAAAKYVPNWLDFKKFGILDRMYDEGNNTLSIVVDPTRKTGSPLIDEEERGRLYSIVSWNGSPGLPQWGYKEPVGNETPTSNSKCNMLEGSYEGTIFPLDLQKNWTFRIYRKFVCRPVPVEYSHPGLSKDGYEGYYYSVKRDFLDTYEENPDNECYCPDKDFCLPQGLGDMSPCYYGLPAAVSQPHFLHADPAILDRIEGMNPDPEKHDSTILVHPKLGLLLQGYSRMQTNLVMRRTKFISRTARFNNMVLPLFWSEMSVDQLPPELSRLMFLLYTVLPPIQIAFIYILGIIGACLIAVAGYKVLFTEYSSTELSPLGVHYSPVRIIPVIRRNSVISEMRDHHKRCNLRAH